MALAHQVLGGTDVGMEREHNEDAHATVALDAGWLLLVCDGMGGHEAGEVASAVALERLRTDLSAPAQEDPGPRLRAALVQANEAVLDASEQTGHPGMGTTAVVGLVQDDRLWFGWVGDSRLYLFQKGQLVQRSVDHTHVQRLVDAGVLTEEEARDHPDANVLVQALGGGRGNQLELSPSVEGPFSLQQGDVVMLCSDGLYDLLEDEEIYPLIAGLPLGQAVDRLIGEANRRGGHDNITVVLLVAGQEHVDPLPEGFVAQRRPRMIRAPAPVEDESALATWRTRALRYLIPLLMGVGAGAVVSWLIRARG